MLLTSWVLSKGEVVLNRVIFSDEQNDFQLKSLRQQLSGKILRIVIRELLTRPLFLSFSTDKVTFLSEYEGQPDCSVEMPFRALEKLRNREKIPELIRDSDLEVAGDLRVVQLFVSLLDITNWSIADGLAPYLGDGLAHGVADALQDGWAFLQKNATKQKKMLCNVVHNELGLFPKRHEMVEFVETVAEITERTDMISHRIDSLMQKIESNRA